MDETVSDTAQSAVEQQAPITLNSLLETPFNVNETFEKNDIFSENNMKEIQQTVLNIKEQLNTLNNCERNDEIEITQKISNGTKNESFKETDECVAKPKMKRKNPIVIKPDEDSDNFENDKELVNVTTPVIQRTSTPPQTVKKRGRPKKINSETPKNRGKYKKQSTPTPSEDLTNTPTDFTPPSEPVKKRGRGRPKTRKNSDSDSTNSNETPVNTAQMETSKSGRKRKKINYFNLENNFLEDDYTSEGLGERKKKKTSSSDEDFYDPQLRYVKVTPRDGKSTRNAIKEDKVKIDDKKGGDVGKENFDVEEDKQTETITIEDETDANNTRYKFTGETKKMMRSVFSAAFHKATDENDLSNSNTESDSEETVTCGSCKVKVSKSKWSKHNRMIHYNLAWYEGEVFMNIDDDTSLKKILKPILQEEKTLKCYKCRESFNKTNDYIYHKEICERLLINGNYTCAVCNEQVERSKWLYHKKKHNNLTWRINEAPLDLKNQTLVVSILNVQYKNKIPLYCYKCNVSKRSVIGFLSHQAQCGVKMEEAQVKCDICNKKMLPVSLPTHIKMVHKTPKIKGNNDNIVHGKRKAAQNALTIIDSMNKDHTEENVDKNISKNTKFKNETFAVKLLRKELDDNKILPCKFKDCVFETAVLDDALSHFEVCPLKPEQFFTCTYCLTVFLLENDVKDHIISNHGDDEIYSDEEESSSEEREETVGKSGKNNKETVRRVSLNNKAKPKCIRHCMKLPQKLFQCAFEYSLEFCNEHYTQSVLFDDLRYTKSQWKLLESNFNEYLPPAQESCQISKVIVKNFENILDREHTFEKYQTLQVEKDENVTTIFCGGPIFAMAWLPTPHILLRCNQFLAVGIGRDFDGKYLINSNFDEKTLIQIWDFGVLKKKEIAPEPTPYIMLAINYGPVWHLEWCPSGCYDEKVPSNKETHQRMGLLAVAGSQPDVCIYSIPFLKDDDEKGLMYKPRPSIKLRLTASNESKNNHFPTKISWSKTSGHNHIAVGYTNGIVAIYNLNTDSETLKVARNIFLPYKIIKAHTHFISVLQLIPVENGARWLLTGSFDGNSYIWDLTNNTKICQPRKKMITDGVWLNNWLSYITTTDESNSKNLWINACLSAHKNYLAEPTYVSTSPSTLTSVSWSDWLNGIAHCSSQGEIITLFPNQLLYKYDGDKKMKSYKYCLGYTRIIDKHKSPKERVIEEAKKQKTLQPYRDGSDRKCDTIAFLLDNKDNHYNEYEPLTYREAINKYGLVFCDMKMKSFRDFPLGLHESLTTNNDKFEMSKPNLYPLQKINKICFNPNCQASLYFGVGYQTGFLRVFYMKFLENDKQVV